MRQKRSTWIAASLAAEHSRALLSLARDVAPWVDAVEIRLDLMGSFDLAHLLTNLPLPAIVTYRPRREGGQYDGDEASRLLTLQRAAALGASVIDVEWDAVDAIGDVSPARVMVSRHFFSGIPSSPERVWVELARLGDIVKLAAHAHTLSDALRLCRLWSRVDKPTVLIAMGPAGVVSRLCAPHFPHAFLTYGAASIDRAVAPGQIDVRTMHERFHIHRITPTTTVHAFIAPDAMASPLIPEWNRRWAQEGRDEVVLPFPITPRDDPEHVRTMIRTLGFLPVDALSSL